MKKTLIFIALSFCLSYARAQWQEITQYGPVNDFLYINDKLMYIWGDTNYIVENGQARIVDDFGFEKIHGDIYTPSRPADFINGKKIGFMWKKNDSKPGSLDVYKTIDGGISWQNFAYFNYPNNLIWVSPIAIDSESVFFQGWCRNLINSTEGALPLIKISKNNKLESFYPKVKFGEYWRSNVVVKDMYFFDSLYGIATIGPSPNSEKNSIVRTYNGGRNFNILDSNYYNENGGEVIAINKKIIIMMAPYSLSISTDSGMNWKSIKKIKYKSPKTDTLATGATIIKGDLFYIRENILYNSKHPTISILYHKRLTDELIDSVIIKPAQFIECYDSNKCFMYYTTFYQNLLPIVHPLSDKDISIKQDIMPKILYNKDNIELVFPSTAQNNQFQIMLYDMSGKLILTENIPKQTENYKLRLNESLPQGIYIIGLRSNSQFFSLKFFK
jgi:hypothetical protein